MIGNSELGTNKTEVAAAVEAGVMIAGSESLTHEDIAAFVLPKDARLEVVDLTRDPKYTGIPERAAGQALVWDATSFNSFWTKYAAEDISEVYADVEAFTVTGVINAHAATTDNGYGTPGWGDFGVKLDVRKTIQWKAWEANDGRLMTQSDFAEHVENRLIDFHEPTGAEMLELAQSFQATTAVEFESAQILSSSERKLVFKETVAARAGQRGEIPIPATFVLGLKPFEGSEAYSVIARLRYRIREGNLLIGYKLERPEDILAAAFSDVLAVIERHVDPTPVLRGKAR